MNIVVDRDEVVAFSDALKEKSKSTKETVLSFTEMAKIVKSLYFQYPKIGEKMVNKTLENLDFGDAKEIPNYSFVGIRTKKVTGKNVERIGNYAFASLRVLYNNTVVDESTPIEEIDFPNVRYIENYAFAYCKNLTRIAFSSKLSTLGYGAFYNCNAITSIEFHGLPTSLDSGAFNYCSNLKDIYVPWKEDDVRYAPWGASNATVHYETTYPGKTFGFAFNDKKLGNGEDDYSGSYSQPIIWYDSQGAKTTQIPTDVVFNWSINNVPGASIDSSNGEITLTDISVGTNIAVTANSDTYGSSSYYIHIVKAGYNIDLNDGEWEDSETTVNNFKVYRSNKGSYHVYPGQSLARITLFGYKKFVIYIRSWAYIYTNYVRTYKLDTTGQNASDIYKQTYDLNSNTNYLRVEYSVPDMNEHTIDILYKKQSSYAPNDDRGYFYVAENECE